MWDTTTHTMILAVVTVFAIASCTSGSDEAFTTEPASPTPTEIPDPTPTATPAPIVGIRGAVGLGGPVFPLFGNGGYDISHYDLDMTVDPEANTLEATATIIIKATANLAAFNFDFAGPPISAVLVNGDPAVFTRDEYELTIEPLTVIPDGSEFTVRIEYSGTPEPLIYPGFPRMGWTRTPIRNSIIVHGFPFALIPSNYTPLDKATFTLNVTAPKPFVVSASGTLISTIDHGETSTYVWDSPVPIQGVHFIVSEAVFESVPGPNGMTINNYFGGEASDATKEQFDIVSEIIEVFTDRFGPFPYDSFGFTYAPDAGFAGFAAAGRSFVRFADDLLFAHEIAHEWYGHSISVSPTDNWMSEGFASYAELLWIEHTDGADAAARAADGYRSLIGSTTRPPAIAQTASEVRDGTAYLRGGLTLYQLRLNLGDDDFFNIMQTFSERFRHSAATTADFIAIAEEISQRDLGEFFDAWVYSRPVPAPVP